MKITAVRASWLRAVISTERQHVSDFGRNDSFNTCLVEIDTDAGLTGVGEAKVGVGNLGNYAAVVETIHPLLHELVQEPFDLRDGFVHASDRPGLGITLNREFARSITV
jgi:L-alanine-DL-glutamate epimerase-like enolase superfamily enzyme